MKNQPLKIEDVFSIFAGMPLSQPILIGLSAITWLVGVNILVAYHYKRRGKYWASGLKLGAFPFNNFTVKEWLILGTLAIPALSFIVLAVSYGKL